MDWFGLWALPRAQRLFYFGSRSVAGFASSFEAVEKPPASIRTERAKASTSKTAATFLRHFYWNLALCLGSGVCRRIHIPVDPQPLMQSRVFGPFIAIIVPYLFDAIDIYL